MCSWVVIEVIDYEWLYISGEKLYCWVYLCIIDFVLINYVLLEIIDDLINILVMFCWNSIIVEFFIRERVRNGVRKNNYKS